jgi:hypothetical protein
MEKNYIMTKFTSFDRKNLNALRAEMEAVLAKYGVESNLEFSVGGMKFSSSDVEIKVSAKVKGAKTFNDVVLESRVKALGLVMEKNGAKLVRYDSKKFKFPFIYEKNGKLFKTSEEYAKFLFAA